MLIQLWHRNSQRIKKEIFAVCLIEKKVLKQDQNNGNISFIWKLERGILYCSLGACHICKTFLGEEQIDFRWHHWGDSHKGGRKFWRGSDHHVFFSLEKSHLQKLIKHISYPQLLPAFECSSFIKQMQVFNKENDNLTIMVKMCKNILLFGHMVMFVSVNICDVTVCVFRNFQIPNSYICQ